MAVSIASLQMIATCVLTVLTSHKLPSDLWKNTGKKSPWISRLCATSEPCSSYLHFICLSLLPSGLGPTGYGLDLTFLCVFSVWYRVDSPQVCLAALFPCFHLKLLYPKPNHHFHHYLALPFFFPIP